MRDNSRCFASKAKKTIIDILRSDGKTMCFGSTHDEIRQRYPDAEEMTVDDFCDWMAEQQRTPITWISTTEDRFNEMLEVLPPADQMNGFAAFLVGEPIDHDAGNGEPRYEGYRRDGGKWFVSSRPITRKEFQAEMQH
jgi:hypothetical protein